MTRLAGLLLVAIVATACSIDLQGQAGQTPAQQRDLITVEKVDFPVVVSASGILEAEQNVAIGAPQISQERRFSFKLARLVDEGAEVIEGDFLMEYDGSDISRRLRNVTSQYQRVQQEYQKKRSDFEVRRKEMQLQLEQAKADLEKLENKLSQQQELESRIMVEETRMRRDLAKKRYALLQTKAEAQEQSGRLDLQLSRSNENHYKTQIDRLMDAMDSLTVRAPVAGVVIHRKGWNGQGKQVGDNVNLMDVVIDLPDLSTLRLKSMVDEVDAGKVKIGQPALVQVDAVQGRVVEGVVDEISGILKQASSDRPLKIAETFVRITEKELGQMRPGMSGKVQIEVDRHKDVLVIPLSAVLERDGRSFVEYRKPETGEFELREIEIQTSNELAAVVRSGLRQGDTIRSRPKPTN